MIGVGSGSEYLDGEMDCRALSHRFRRGRMYHSVEGDELHIDFLVDEKGVKATGFDLMTDDNPRLELITLGLLQSFRQHAEEYPRTVPTLVVLSQTRETVQPLMARAGYKMYRRVTEDNHDGIIGVLEDL